MSSEKISIEAKKEISKDEELILVTPSNLIGKVGSFQGFITDVEPYLNEIFDKNQTSFMVRNLAEKNPDFKQIIPYCLVVQSNKILVYQRGQSGGENRLKNLWSCGIGGHINPIDSTNSEKLEPTQAFSRESLRKALLRELNEELNLPEGNIEFKTVGLINDDSNDVGKVHLGLVEIAILPSNTSNSNQNITPAEDAISNLKLISFEELSSIEENLENWSKIVAKNIKTILASPVNKTNQLKEFHLDIGDEKGILGIGAVIKAPSKLDAVNIIEKFLPEEISLNHLFGEETLKQSSIEYINLYLRKENLIKEQIEFKENE